MISAIHFNFPVKKIFYLAAASLWLVAGCTPIFKKGWQNFRAHYNTYYNAKRNYHKGLKKVKKQEIEINPLKPVRIHTAPLQAGSEDFQAAIDKGAKILQDYPQSRWADDAVLLIGKSYYYRGEFYHALEKFIQLQNLPTPVKLQQLAVVWKGRTLLDVHQNDRAVSYLRNYVRDYPDQWPAKYKAEMQALMGEHLAALGQWQASAQWLKKAAVHLKGEARKGRAYFLLGQVLARQQKFAEAYQAYTKVGNHFSGFAYSFWAKMKVAGMARKQHNLSRALSVYGELLNNDKFFRRRREIRFQIARTYEIAGKIQEAEDNYGQLLHEDDYRRGTNIDANIYYRLGKINSDVYKKYSLAAAYFDSSAAASKQKNTSVSLEDAHELAAAYGKYTRLRNKIERTNRLLYLGSLKPSARDSAISKIKTIYRNQRSQQRSANRNSGLRNVEIEPQYRSLAGSSKFGFLNHRNANLIRQQKAQFRAIWGNRPLVDNWRRSASIRNIVNEKQTAEGRSAKERAADNAVEDDLKPELSAIPSTLTQKNALKKDQVQAEYKLGNLTFLRLNMPDSARHFFYRVVSSNKADSLRPKAMYALYQIFSSQNKADSAARWKNSILERYPHTSYAGKLSHKENAAVRNASSSSNDLAAEYHSMTDSSKYPLPSNLRQLALQYPSSPLAADIYYKAIKAYIRQAKRADSIAAEFSPDFYSSPSSRYQSTYWDSVRLVLTEFDTAFAHSRYHLKVKLLKTVLENKKSPVETPSCKKLEIIPKMDPPMKSFLNTVHYPDKFKGKSLSGTITFSFLLTKQGEIKSFKRVSSQTLPGIQKAFEKAFGNVKFAPFSSRLKADQIRCTKTFPINH